MDRTKAHVLIVDDDEHLPRAYARLFKRHGFAQVSIERNGRDGAKRCLEDPSIHIVLSDLEMGGGGRDGDDMYRAVHDVLKARDGLFFFMTGSVDMRVVGRIRRLGVPIFDKPLDFETVLSFLT